VEVALCGSTPYYDELLAKFRSAQAFWGLSDQLLAQYDFRFVPDWFTILYPKDPWAPTIEWIEKVVMGVVAVDVRDIRVSWKDENLQDKEWERTLVHELGHLYCHEHPELRVAWDPYHQATEVWAKADAYHYK